MGKETPLIWIISGEASGDDYGAALAQCLWRRQPGCRIRGMGGPKMRQAGVELFEDSSELGVVGLMEVLKHLFFFVNLLRRLTVLAAHERPDAVVLIDYPGFNIRFAKRLHNLGLKVVYYISPQVWAWKKGRIKLLEKYTDLMLCIFPFEPAVYSGTSLRTEFVGHPLLSRLKPYTIDYKARKLETILLLPGSRRSELKSLLPPFIQAAAILKQRHPELQFRLPCPRPAIADFAREILSSYPEACKVAAPEVSVGNTRELLGRSGAALAASGTVTVEAGILDLPVVVSYKLNPITWQLAIRLVKLNSITIANLVMKKTVYQELLQSDATPEKLALALERILPGTAGNAETRKDLAEFRSRLGGDRNADDNVARLVLELVQ